MADHFYGVALGAKGPADVTFGTSTGSRPGGGDQAIVAATRGATGEALLAAALDRARRLLTPGATTVEVKSGLGVSVAGELRLLRTIHELARAAWGEVTVDADAPPGPAAPSRGPGRA